MKLADIKFTQEVIAKIYKATKVSLALFFLICAVNMITYTKINSLNSSLPLYCGLAFIMVASIISIISIKIKKLDVLSLVMISMSISAIGSLPYNSVYLLFLLPTILSLYSFNKKFICWVAALSGFLFVLSSNMRAYETIKNALIMKSSSSMYVGTTFIGVYEVFIILFAALPIFMYYINSDLYQWEFRKEKMKAEGDILHFCSAVSIYHNKYLEAHINGVRDITKIILDGIIEEGIEVNKYYYDQIIFSVQFHDIGKTYIPPAILDKPGCLTEEELTIIKEHPQRGLELLELLPKNSMGNHTFDICRNIVYQHHERRDGSGYPQGLKGDEIRFEAELVAVADVLDALLSWRPYKPPMSFERAQAILESESEKYNELCLRVALKHKDEILKVSNRNNKILQEKFSLSNTDVERV